MKKVQFLFASLLVMVSTSVLAHPGHNHEHWSSNAVHFLYFVAIAAALSVAWKAVKSFQRTNKIKAQQ